MPFTEILPPFLSNQKHSNDNKNKNPTNEDDCVSRQHDDEHLFVEAFAVQVEPQLCGSLIRQLQNQDTELQHLKRVKVIPLVSRHGNDALKRQKVSEQRLVLLGTDRAVMEERYSQQYTIQRVRIPKRPPNSESEWNRMNEEWPTKKVNYLAIEQELQARRIQPEENSFMEKAIQQVMIDKDTVLLDPSSGDVVGRASVERRLQLGATTSLDNPLQTDILYAIQNVSRRERTKQSTSYLCTGFDLYTVQEPSLFEGMAALHSRVRRIIFVHPSPTQLGALTHYCLHTLSSTNHHFRAFQWNEIPPGNH